MASQTNPSGKQIKSVRISFLMFGYLLSFKITNAKLNQIFTENTDFRQYRYMISDMLGLLPGRINGLLDQVLAIVECLHLRAEEVQEQYDK